jgi:hypothetical protein
MQGKSKMAPFPASAGDKATPLKTIELLNVPAE